MSLYSLWDRIRWPLILKKSRSNNALSVIILGHPRSGTSFIAGLVKRMGYSFGPERWLKKGNLHNPHGYYECKPLMAISTQIFGKFGGDFFNLPQMPDNWTSLVESERRDILYLVARGGIQAYKDNYLLVLANLYDEIFPDAKWIFVHRPVEETYLSRFGQEISFKVWQGITQARQSRWEKSTPYSKSLLIENRMFKENLEQVLTIIQNYLEIALTIQQKQECLEFYQPRGI